MPDKRESTAAITALAADNGQEVIIEEPNHLHDPVADDSFGRTSNTKNILVLIGITIILFVIVISGFSIYNNITSAGIINLDDLHKDNLEGNLNEEIDGYVYNGFSFVKADGLWWTEINKFGTRLKIPLHFAPRELEGVIFTGDLNPAFNDGEDVYVAINPKVINQHYTLAISELSFNLAKGLDRRPVGSCTEENEVCEDREVINCENAEGRPVIELMISETPEIEFQDTCIRVKGTGWELVKGVNRLLYQWYGVMG
ncbi:MAG TPA: hypothetical protein VJH68_00505 [Candidatus Nanoarchaeia archaeon]|nr:hypothetical protein [Candidatus Nanoarchaeia archaeon]